MLRKWLPHAAILLSNMYIVFFVLDRVNSAMTFINNGITKGLLLILALISIVNGCLLISDRRRGIRAAQKRARRVAQGFGPSAVQSPTRTVSRPAQSAAKRPPV